MLVEDRILKTISFFLCLLETSIKASISNKSAFILESILMITNNLIFLLMWWIFFRQFEDIGGWKINDMLALISICTGACGLMQICFGGVQYLGRVIVNGDLDLFMTQPKNLLLYLSSSKSLSKGWGFLMTSAIVIVLGDLFTGFQLPLIFLSMVSGCLVYTSVTIIVHSLTFWLGPIEDISKKYTDSLLLFSFYPTNIYSGFLKFVMYTFVPAGVIGCIPVELLRSFSWVKLVVLLSFSGGFVILASFVFHLGLKKYESGNRFGMRL